MVKQDKEILQELACSLHKNKAGHIIFLDVRGVCPFADYFLIAEGNVEKHVQALARVVKEELKKENILLIDIAGYASGEWVVLDAGVFLIHLFTKPMRDYYRLEEMWKQGKIIDLDINWEERK
jgi:ribosome-associated protein